MNHHGLAAGALKVQVNMARVGTLLLQYKPWGWRAPELRGQRWREGKQILIIDSTHLGFKLKVENVVFSQIKVKPWVTFSAVTIMFYVF